MDDDGAALGDRDRVAVPPDARETSRSRRRGSRSPSGSSQKRSGIDGIGSVITISPGVAGGRPVRRRRPTPRAATPSAGGADLAVVDRGVGALATKIPTMSVPPLIEPSWMRRADVLTDPRVGARRAAPIRSRRSVATAERSRSRPGSRPARWDAAEVAGAGAEDGDPEVGDDPPQSVGGGCRAARRRGRSSRRAAARRPARSTSSSWAW